VVLVIGSTGRNFAAGMSGGIAYVLDEIGDFSKRCNMTMVKLETVTKAAIKLTGLEAVMQDMLADDEMRIKTLITNHLQYTDSSRAKKILDNWDEYLPKFVKVMPVDYRRALMQMREEG
ncbi:MAG: glutamate synthase large subunit, partial [Proteobacteria bacterium]|nr:glutamate synthase large subunit [Pseudomonadota bacterium]